MSRISGIYSHKKSKGELNFTHFLKNQSQPGWKSKSFSKDEIEMGWTGWKSPSIHIGPRNAVFLDGCIYNHLEFGAQLTDAHLISNLFDKYGFENCLQKLNGDFSVAVYDLSNHSLWIARDRFGVKPLYFTENSKFFSFSSRIKPFLSMNDVDWMPSQKFVSVFAGSHYRYIDNDPWSSPYENISQCPASHYLHVNKNGIVKKRYWNLEDHADFQDSEEILAQRYQELLIDAVSLRLKKTSSPGFTLSGGMDSSSIISCAFQSTHQKQVAVSSVYDDKTFDESEDIKSILNDTVSHWNPVKINVPDVGSLINNMISQHDEPVATATWLSHYLICQETSSLGISSLFSGLGGDELNAGEYEYFFYYFADLKITNKTSQLEDEIKKWNLHHDHPIFHKNSAVVEKTFSRVINFEEMKCIPDDNRRLKYAHAINSEFFDIKKITPYVDHPFRSFLKNRTYHDLFRETMPCCLRAEDRHTSAHNIDHFFPFLDSRLVEFMFRVPGSLKIKSGITKHLLRRAMRGIVPEQTRTRIKKTGWNAPAHIWFTDKNNKELLLDLISSTQFRNRGIYNIDIVENIIQEHDEIIRTNRPVENHMMFLWQLLNLEIWLQWVDRIKKVSC